MKPPAGMPGLGGSLGWCAVCGKPFLLEILMNKSVKSFEVTGCDNTLFAHDACINSLPKDGEHFDVLTLPPESPLRQAYETRQPIPTVTQNTTDDQPAILRLLSEQGMDGKIKPLTPSRPGCVTLFPDINTDICTVGTWYIVDRMDDFYILTTLSEATATEAIAAYREYARRFVRGPADLRMHLEEKPVSAHN